MSQTIEARDSVGRFHVYKLVLADKIVNPNNGGRIPLVQVKAGIGKLMDWTPRVTLRANSQWMFRPEDLNLFCVTDKSCGNP